jgi:hypothetical protein
LYPPLSAALPGISGSDPVVGPPVSSIRWEMLREGIEDDEYLRLLCDLIRKSVPRSRRSSSRHTTRCWRFPGLSPAT